MARENRRQWVSDLRRLLSGVLPRSEGSDRLPASSTLSVAVRVRSRKAERVFLKSSMDAGLPSTASVPWISVTAVPVWPAFGVVGDLETLLDVQAPRDVCEGLADDVRALSTLVHALRGALVSEGLLKGGM